MKATLEALAHGYGGSVELHAVTDIKLDRRHGAKWLTSTTVFPDGVRTDEERVHIILSLAKRIGADALVPVWTDDVAFVARNRDALKGSNPVLVPNDELMAQCMHKRSFIQLTQSLGFSAPQSVALTANLDVDETIDRLGLPMLAKPVFGEGGKGIVKISNETDLRNLLESPAVDAGRILQEIVTGEDVALTLLADRGRTFAVMLRKRWFSRWKARAFSPIVDVEFFRKDELEEVGRSFVAQTRFSGIADFDLRVDFASGRVWFLESDPRMMGGLTAARLFGLNVPWLLVEQARGRLSDNVCIYAEPGRFLSIRSIPQWVMSIAWKDRRKGPLRTNIRARIWKPK